MTDAGGGIDTITYTAFRTKFERIRLLGAGEGYRIPAQYAHVRLQKVDRRRIGVTVLCHEKPATPVSLQLLSCEVEELDDGWALSVVEREPNDERLIPFFVDLCRRIYLAPDTDKAAAIVKSVVSEWNRAFSKDQGLLSPEEMLGIAGELEVLSRMLKAHTPGLHNDVLSWWQGPASADHDFDLPDRCQIEVKTTGPATERLRISNEHQLESHDKPLYLACVRAERADGSPDAATLPDMVEELVELITDKTAVFTLRHKIQQTGLNVLDTRYEEYRFKVYSTDYYSINDSTPRLVPADLRPGVSHVSYQIYTSDLESHSVTQTEVFKEK